MAVPQNWILAFFHGSCMTLQPLRGRHHQAVGLGVLRRAPMLHGKHGIVTRRAIQSVLLLGGTSGVGMETAQYLEGHGVETTAISRRTGHDLQDANVLRNLIQQTKTSSVGVMIGGGRVTNVSIDDEIKLYKTIIQTITASKRIGDDSMARLVFVTRPLVVGDVQTMLYDAGCSIPWVILRPGPMDFHRASNSKSASNEQLLVTPDLRCNGYVSRAAVATVVGDLLMSHVDINMKSIARQVLGVYDNNRMIRTVDHAVDVSGHAWGRFIN